MRLSVLIVSSARSSKSVISMIVPRAWSGVADRLDELSVPTLVVHGEDDQSIEPERAAPVAEAAPDGRLVTVPDADHTPTVERSEPTTEALRSFLDDVT